MTTRKVPVKRCIVQVTDGKEYRGRIELGGVEFEFEIQFTVPIPQLDTIPPAENIGDVRKTMPVSLKKGGVPIRLTDEEYKFLIQLLAGYAVEFYTLPKTRADNFVGMVGAAYGMPMPSPWDEVPATWHLPAEACALFSTPKFSCNFN